MAAWWEEAFRGDYLRVYAARDDASAAAEIGAWVGRLPGLDRGERVLDLACGGGRHLRALRARGVRAAGCDLSPDLLRAAAAGGDRCITRCDMRALPFRDGAFAAVTSFFSSFGYFDRGEEDAAVLAEAARVLRPGGALLLDLPDPDAVRAGLVPRSERAQGGTRIVEERRLADGGRRVEKEVLLEDGGGARRWRESLRLYGPEEAEGLAAAAGLAPGGRFAGHGTAPWRAGASPRCVLLLRKGAA